MNSNYDNQHLVQRTKRKSVQNFRTFSVYFYSYDPAHEICMGESFLNFLMQNSMESQPQNSGGSGVS